MQAERASLAPPRRTVSRWLIALVLSLFSNHARAADDLSTKVWIHGSEDCSTHRDPAIEVFQFDADTFILRQSKCVHFEAPFIYVLFGEHTVFVQDTGATEEPDRFPLFETVQSLIARRGPRAGAPLGILVTHSHSHSDHTAADAQFRGKPGVTLVEPNADAVRRHFRFGNWPNGTSRIDLGGRELLVIPTPGHHDEHVAVYDSRTRWLLTGDTVYPGQLYVMDWPAYKASVHRLAEFADTHAVSAVMGTHIEMSRTSGKLFARGSTFQPQEAGLALTAADLRMLDASLRRSGDEPMEIPLGKFVVTPVSPFVRALGALLEWLGVL